MLCSTAYREESREAVRMEYQRKYRAANRERVKEYRRKYWVANKDKIAKTRKEVSRREREYMAADAVTHGKLTKAMSCTNAPSHRME